MLVCFRFEFGKLVDKIYFCGLDKIRIVWYNMRRIQQNPTTSSKEVKMKKKLSREQLKALRKEGAKYPRILGYVVSSNNYNAPIVSATFHDWRLYAVWEEGESVADLRWTEEDPRAEMTPTRKQGLWVWRRSI
jgi:hypothetical protein